MPENLLPAFATFFWSPETGRLYYDDFKEVGPSTYLRPISSNPWYNFWSPPRALNPSHYATDATALRMRDLIRTWYPTLTVNVSYGKITGNVSALEAFITVTGVTGVSENFNAGLLAFSLDKNGETWFRDSFRTELKTAHIIP